jgi:hypothetical protein
LIADVGDRGSGYKIYLNLRMYPALLLVYTGGIAAVAARNYGNLATLVVRAIGHIPFQKEAPLGHVLTPESILDRDVAHNLLQAENRYTPVNDYLYSALRESLRGLIPRETDYEQYFDRFEYLFALISGDLYEKIESYTAWSVGSFLWRDRDHFGSKESVLGDLYREIENKGQDWPGFKAGLFDSLLERFQFIKSKFDEELPNLRGSRRIW